MMAGHTPYANAVKFSDGNRRTNWMQTPWQEVTFTYPQKGKSIGRIAFHDPEKKYKLQYLLTSQVYALLEIQRNYGFVFDVKLPGVISVNTNTYLNPDVLCDVLRTYIDKIVIFIIVMGSEAAKDVYIPTTPPVNLSYSSAMIIKDVEVFVCLADREHTMNEILKSVGYTFIDRVDVSLIQENLKDLGIEKEVLGLDFNLKAIMIDTGSQICSFIWNGNRRQNGMNLIQQFIEKCNTTVIEFDTRGISWIKHAFPLIFPHQNVKHSSFVKYIKSKCAAYLPNVFPFSLIGDTDGRICVVQRHTKSHDLEILIRNSLCFHKSRRFVFETEAFKQIIEHKTETVWFDTENEFVVCTDDLYESVSYLISTLELSNRQLVRSELLPVYVRTFENELIKKCKTEFNVDVNVHDTSIVLEAQNRAQLDKCSHFLDAVFKKRHSRIVIAQRSFKPCMKALSNALPTDGCCWVLLSNDKNDVMNTHSKIWLDPYRSSIFHVKNIESCIHEDADLLVELTDENLIPLDVKFRQQALQPMSADSRVCKSSDPNNEIKMGGIIQQSILAMPKGRHSFKEAMSIVCKMGDGSDIRVISNDELRKSFFTLFSKVRQMERSHLCICTSLDGSVGDKLNDCDIVKQLVLALSSLNKSPSYSVTVDIHVKERALFHVTKEIETALMKQYMACVHVPDYFTPKALRIQLIVKSGCIQHEQADVIVCPVTSFWTFWGKCAEGIKAEAGEDMIKECHRKYPNNIQEWFVGFTKAYKLSSNHVKYVFHTQIPHYQNGHEQMLRQVVKTCLLLAEEQCCESIAFPVLGVGRLTYPWRETAFQMFEAVSEYEKESRKTTIKTIKFVIFEKGECLHQIFLNEEYRRSNRCTAIPRMALQIDNIDLQIHRKPIGSFGLTLLRVIARSHATFPPYAVEFIFDNVDVKWVRKCALAEPVSWNDQIKLQHGMDNFPREISNQLRDEGATHVFWNLATGPQRVHGNQVRQVVAMMESMCRNETLTHLKIIDIIVPDATAVESFRVQTDLSGWESVCPDESEYVLELMAKSNHDLEKAMRSILKVLFDKSDLYNTPSEQETVPDVSTGSKDVPQNAATTYSASSQASQAAVETQPDTQNTLTSATSSHQSSLTVASQKGKNIGKCHGTNSSLLKESPITDASKQMNVTTSVYTTSSTSSIVFSASLGGHTLQDNIAAYKGSEKSSSFSNVQGTTDQNKVTPKSTDAHSHSFKGLPVNGMNAQDVPATSTMQVPKDKQNIYSETLTGNLKILESSTQEQKLEYEQHSELSAIINPGIIHFLQTQVSSWIDSMENQFAVKISGNKDANYKVSGTYEAVVAFENCLEKNFPE